MPQVVVMFDSLRGVGQISPVVQLWQGRATTIAASLLSAARQTRGVFTYTNCTRQHCSSRVFNILRESCWHTSAPIPLSLNTLRTLPTGLAFTATVCRADAGYPASDCMCVMMASIWSTSMSMALGLSSVNSPCFTAAAKAAHLRLWDACMEDMNALIDQARN